MADGLNAGGMGMEDWSNNACLGYAILAAKRMKLTEKETQKFIESVRAQFDSVSVEDAAKIYCSSPY
jgi:hypothetical protein